MDASIINKTERRTRPLTVKEVEHFKGPGKLFDPGCKGLYVIADAEGRKRWVLRFTDANGKRREMGLGTVGKDGVDLETVRLRARSARDTLRRGTDPIAARAEAAKPPVVTPKFGAFADDFVGRIESEFRNAKHKAQWKSTLGDTYCKSLRGLRIDVIGPDDILKVLQPIWLEKNETASRIRGRIERVLDAAKAEGFRTGDNPAVWRGGLKASLPRRQKLQRGHHKALPYDQVPALVSGLRDRRAPAARALEFLILTASRSGEVRAADWKEFDFLAKIWTVPAERMKAGRPHRVPLTPRMIEILGVDPTKPLVSGLVFPSQRGNPMSDMVFAKLLERMSLTGITTHGFRSSFRDWVGEATSYQREVAEAALAHTIGDATERAYRRGDALDRRRELMEAWEVFCETPPLGMQSAPL
jgi:integrase